MMPRSILEKGRKQREKDKEQKESSINVSSTVRKPIKEEEYNGVLHGFNGRRLFLADERSSR